MTWPSDGRPRQKSVDRSGRPMCTNVHNQFGWRVGRPTRSTPRELCSLDLAPVDQAVDRQRACFLYSGLGRPGDRPVAQRSEIWPLAGRPGGRPTTGFPAELDPNGYIFEAYKLGLFSTRFLESFQSSFSYLTKCLSPLVLEPIFSYQKESLSRVFSKEISWVFPPLFYLVFSHILELSIAISIL